MIQAIIFDLDGTILDNEQLWEEAFQSAGYTVPASKLQDNGWIHEPGIGVGPNWQRIVADSSQAEDLAKKTYVRYWEKVGEVGNLPVRDGVEELLDYIKAKGFLTALATSSNWTMVEKELEALESSLAFDITTTGDELTRLKPDPEIFLLTAQKLGVEPQDCLVIEDSLAGVMAAHEIGMKVVGLVSSYADTESLQLAGADWVVDNLNEVVVLLADGNQDQSQDQKDDSPNRTQN